MVWAILALLGVPLWVCAAGLFVVVFNNHRLRTRPGNIPVRVKRPGTDRWTRARALGVRRVPVARQPGSLERGSPTGRRRLPA